MKSKQLYYGLTGLLILLGLGFIGVAYEANSALGKQATKLSKLRADSEVLDNTQVQLARNKQDIAKYKDLNSIAASIVPQDKDQAEAVREIVSLAQQSGINKLTSLTFPSSTLGATVGATGNSNLTQLTPVKGMAGVYQLQITVTQGSGDEVPYSQLTSFLEKLEQNRRTAQVSSITVQPKAENPNLVTFTLVINEYIKP